MSIVKVNFFSESLMRTVNFLAIIPIDKRSVDGHLVRSKEKPFKTLYLLHGVYGSEYDWIAGTRIRQWAQDWNLAVIMPAGENKFYCDNPASGDLFGRFVGEELVNFTRSMFHLSETREDTYIAGLSMGGLGAIYTGLRYPDTFGYIGAFSSGLITDQYPKDDESPMLIHRRSFYESVVGPEALFSGGPNDYYALAEKVAHTNQAIPKIYMCCGLQDSLLQVNRRYRDYLYSLNFPLDYFEDEGGHDWIFWDKHIFRLLEWLPLEEKSEALSSGHIE